MWGTEPKKFRPYSGRPGTWQNSTHCERINPRAIICCVLSPADYTRSNWAIVVLQLLCCRRLYYDVRSWETIQRAGQNTVS